MVLGSLIEDGYVFTYVDDIFVASSNFQEHLIHLRNVFEQFKIHNMTVNKEKSKFCIKEVKFLGHTVSAQGLKMDPDKINAVQQFREPKNKKEVQRYLGYLNFDRKFINKYL